MAPILPRLCPTPFRPQQEDPKRRRKSLLQQGFLCLSSSSPSVRPSRFFRRGSDRLHRSDNLHSRIKGSRRSIMHANRHGHALLEGEKPLAGRAVELARRVPDVISRYSIRHDPVIPQARYGASRDSLAILAANRYLSLRGFGTEG